MSASNPFAPGSPRRPKAPRARRAPAHAPVLRRVSRLGLAIPPLVLSLMRQRWAAMTDDERWEAIAADQAKTDDELRAEVREMVELVAAATPEEMAQMRAEVRAGG